MYSQRKVSERIALMQAEFGVTLEYHTVAEVDDFARHMAATGRLTFDDLGKPTGTTNLTAFESSWILNEQLLILCDAVYWLTRYAYVKNEENIIQRFQFRVPQRLLFDIICDLEERDAAIELMILKARQLGCSTLAELLIAHRIIFAYGVNAVIGSADQTKTALMANMLFLAYDMLPVWLRPTFTRRVESDRGMLVFGHTASGVSFQHGAQASGIARGTTPTIYHLSEVASFTDPVKQIEAALFKAVHASPHVFGILESTGEGDKGWWPDTWRHARANWTDHRARLCPVFLPWFCGVNLYPTPTWIRMRPVDPHWLPNRETREHVAKSELYVRANPLLAKHLLIHQRKKGIDDGPRWRMPRDQQWYWEVEHEQAKSKGIESIFLQEMAGDDEEALQRSSESVFGHETIEVLDRNRAAYVAYGLSGQSIEDGHEPPTEDIDYHQERVPVRYASARGEVYRWELIPLTFAIPLREAVPEDATGKLLVFHPPRPRVSYSIGVDTSEGKGEDSTVISVWSVGAKGSPDIQCAEFSSAYVNHVEAFSFVLAIAAFYGQHMETGTTRWKEPYVSIEQVAAVGDTCQLQMRKMGYSNFHRMTRYDSKRVSKHKATRMGWYTYGWSRPLLIGNFVHAAQNGWAEINSPWMIDEMKHFEVHVTSTGKERLEHAEDQHDDRLFAGAMAIFCPHDMDVLADRSKKRSIETNVLPPINLDPAADGMTFTPTMLRADYSRAVDIEELMYNDPRHGAYSRR